MYYHEIKDNLFKYENSYCLAHCISADFALGAGIAKEFDIRYNMKYKLNQSFKDLATNNDIVGSCLFIDNIFNLVTKQLYFNKPTYNSISRSIKAMKGLALNNNITKIAMPLIGCGLDKLNWNRVSEIIKETFQDTDIEILICRKITN